jgi:hypothetical protein
MFRYTKRMSIVFLLAISLISAGVLAQGSYAKTYFTGAAATVHPAPEPAPAPVPVPYYVPINTGFYNNYNSVTTQHQQKKNPNPYFNHSSSNPYFAR